MTIYFGESQKFLFLWPTVMVACELKAKTQGKVLHFLNHIYISVAWQAVQGQVIARYH